jgi:DNA-binding Xre family transcriptional regulator
MDMDIQHYNKLKIVMVKKETTGTWLSEQMGHNIGTISRGMTDKVQTPVKKQLYEIARYLDVDVKELLA